MFLVWSQQVEVTLAMAMRNRFIRYPLSPEVRVLCVRERLKCAANSLLHAEACRKESARADEVTCIDNELPKPICFINFQPENESRSIFRSKFEYASLRDHTFLCYNVNYESDSYTTVVIYFVNVLRYQRTEYRSFLEY